MQRNRWALDKARSDKFIPPMHIVKEECNMIEFAKHVINNYDPDSGKGYFQLLAGSQEYISSKTDVVLINEVHTA